MRVNVAVCGIFHLRKWIAELSARGHLQAFLYSHRMSTTAAALGITRGSAHNFFAKEYLMHASIRYVPPLLRRTVTDALLHDIWEWQAVRALEPGDILHLLAHGNGRAVIARAKSQGQQVLVEPVMSHPQSLRAVLMHEHDALGLPPPPPVTREGRRLEDEIAAGDFLHAGSKVLRDTYVEHGFPLERTVVIPYAVDTSRFYPLTPEERVRFADDKFRVICVGQIIPRKGVHYLLEAWKRLALPKDRAELVIIGTISAPMKPLLERYSGHYTYLGGMAHESLRLQYGRSSVFVLPSVEDGFGLVTTEAMGCGLPVITTRNAGSSDIVEDGGNGYVVEARSSDALADRIQRLYDAPELRAAMSARSLALSTTGNTWTRYVDALIAAYEGMLRR